MTDYFKEYSSIITDKSLPSPADTPYETTSFIRSKRSSRATSESFHDDSNSAATLAPGTAEYQDSSRDGRFGTLDPRRFTPTLHASLVSEILNLRRELDSKNSLVENLEISLSTAKTENEGLSTRLAASSKDVRKARQQVQQMEKGTYEALEDLVKERDAATSTVDELRAKLESVQKKTRHQDEDAVRSQSIWESEKERWDNERRQMERRIHVTETRLRTFVDQMAAQQTSAEPSPAPAVDFADDGTFKDSGLGNESDTASITSSAPVKHTRNKGSFSTPVAITRSSLASRASVVSPELYAKPAGNSLADELGIDEEDESDLEDFENEVEEIEYPERVKRTESRLSDFSGEAESKAKRILGLTTDIPDSPTARNAGSRQTSPINADAQQPSTPLTAPASVEQQAKALPTVVYVDKGYQPSPPTSPELPAQPDQPESNISRLSLHNDDVVSGAAPERISLQDAALVSPSLFAKSPISPPQTPVVSGAVWPPAEAQQALPSNYVTASTQTENARPTPATDNAHARNSLSPPMFVPSIAIHPPSSRPSTPRPSVLPPGTRNASTQAELPWPSRDASMQTEEIRIDRRPVKLPPHLLPSHLLPSPSLPEPRRPRASHGPPLPELITKLPLSDEPRSPPSLQSPTPSSPEAPRRNVSSKDVRSMPLKAIPLPRPVLSPVSSSRETTFGNGPLNRASQYGVIQPRQEISYLADPHDSSDESDFNDQELDADPRMLSSSAAMLSRPPPNRFGLSEPPKAVPENKEISPVRRPQTADSHIGAPAPSISSARASGRTTNYSRPSQKPRPAKDFRSRSPSLGSMASSSNSFNPLAQHPPYPIPNRSSSRALSKTHSEGSRSPTRDHGHRASRSSKANLRKVQSANAIRNKSGKSSPTKPVRRRRRSPELTPVVSMAFDEPPAPTKFPIPDLPTPLQDGPAMHSMQNSVDMGKASTVSSVPPPMDEASLVDAIAATMVGEWMWKYIRKRKSFGITEDTSKFPVDRNGVVDVTGHGIRHKRWVWLSPYERTIMWDTKQPTTGSALLGKKGRKRKLIEFSRAGDATTNKRKVAIQSVLEVKDLSPLPKDAELSSAFNRSILILTPARALKFTATTRERHDLWMTALSFLAQSGQPPAQLLGMPYGRGHAQAPSVPSVDSVPIKRFRSPSFGRGTVRDSIRLAKGKRPDQLLFGNGSRDKLSSSQAAEENGADAPSVPRLYIGTTRHLRKRSNTSPRGPPALGTALRSFSSNAVPSLSSAGSPALHPDYASTTASTSTHNAAHHHHRRGPSASASAGNNSPSSAATLPTPNFFEAVSTMRMEAFVDPNVRDGVLYVPAPPRPPPAPPLSASNAAMPGPAVPRAPHAHHRHLRGDSALSQTTLDRRRAGYVFDEDGLDPFRGF